MGGAKEARRRAAAAPRTMSEPGGLEKAACGPRTKVMQVRDIVGYTEI